MAPVSDSVYFPTLGECLTGAQVVLSWKHVTTALSDVTGRRQLSFAVVEYFQDEYVFRLLKDPARVFAPDDAASQKDFETKTAPINVTPTDDRFDLNTIKDDAKWLSKNAKINLVSALRIVVVEIQSRPSKHLVGALSSQDATNLQEAAGLENGQGSSIISELGGTAAPDAEELWAEFEKPDSRRNRLFETYLSERRNFMMAAEYALAIPLYHDLPILAPLGKAIQDTYRLKLSTRPKEDLEALLSAYLDAVATRMKWVESGLNSQTDDKLLNIEQVELDWLRTLLTEVTHALSVIFQVVDSMGAEFAPSSSVNQWFGLMDLYGFFDRLHPINESVAELLMPLETLCAAVSLSMLKPERALRYLVERDEDPSRADDGHDSYFISPEVLEQVHKSLMNAASAESESACPVIFAWTVLLHQLNVSYQTRTEKRDNLLQQNARETFETGMIPRPSMARRNSAGSIFSIESSKFDGFLENQLIPKDSNVVEQLAAAVTAEGRVYTIVSRMAMLCGPDSSSSMTSLVGSKIRTTFVGLLKVTYPFVGYQSEPLETLVSVLAADRSYWDIVPANGLSAQQDVLATTINDDQTLDFYFQQALDRYPYEFLPFITMCRILASATSLFDDERCDFILDHLRRTPTLTFTLPDAFMNYELVQEDENTNSFTILQDISLIALSSSWKRRYIEDDAYRMPAGTQGRFITDSGRVVVMDYPHSTLSLLGRRLEINLAKEGYRSELGYLQPDEVAETIGLLSTLLRVESIKASRENGYQDLVPAEGDILHETSQHISGGKDIITVVCDTMDYFMQDELAMSDDGSVNVLNKCVQFLDAALPLQPSRIWSYLARSELLNSESRAGKLTKIAGSLELMSERFEFLRSAMRLFKALTDSALSSAVQRRGGNELGSRRNGTHNPWAGTADKVLARVSLSIAQSAVDVFENTSTWKFETVSHRTSLLNSVVPLLNNIVLHGYGMGNAQDEDSLTSCLRPAATYVLDCFLSPNTGTLRFQPILSTLVMAFTASDSTLYPERTRVTHSQVVSMLLFAATLLRASDLLEKSSKILEAYLFKISTLLARLCGLSDHYRSPALWLLDSLVVTGGRSSNDPPSLLGYLGPQVSKSFLQVLAFLDKPFVLGSDVRSTWRFFSSVLRNRQQWMSNCLLTGQTPREAMREASKKELSSHAVFALALTRLKSIKEIEPAEAVAILDFVASAQNYWPWTVFTLQKDTAYLDGLREFVRELKPSQTVAKTDVVRAGYEARIAAYIAETFAMQLYHSRHLGNGNELAKNLSMDLDYYLREGVEVAGYNKSLHANFAKNFAAKYNGCSVEDFKLTSLQSRELGACYYYDIRRADDMLRFDPGWIGRKNNGFKTEMQLANNNLSLVDAQIALFHGWEFLLVELSNCLPSSDNIARHGLQVAHQCLDANQGVPGPESIFLKLVYSRAELALVLVQRLANSKVPRTSDIDQLLSTLVGAINGVNEPYAPESVGYYRTLLKTLYVTLRAYRFGEAGDKGQEDTESPTVSVIQTVLNILDRVVARGFRQLVSFVHEKDVDVSPEDLALLNAILQASLSLPGIEQSQTQIMNIIATHDAVHAATSLFSWADKLAIQGDPVYGELSVLFLLELSALPLVAEQLACDGIISSLLSANLMKYILKANLSPYSDSPISQRSYNIWAKGLLPFMLNLLISLGATVAPEITYVLNQAPHLLESSVDRFEAPGISMTQSSSSPNYITLLATAEAHSLALLTRILGALRMNNNRDIPEVSWDASGMLENVEYWMTNSKVLKERLVPLGAREVEWKGLKTKGGEAKYDNLLEEKVAVQLEAVRAVLNEDLDAS